MAAIIREVLWKIQKDMFVSIENPKAWKLKMQCVMENFPLLLLQWSVCLVMFDVCGVMCSQWCQYSDITLVAGGWWPNWTRCATDRWGMLRRADGYTDTYQYALHLHSVTVISGLFSTFNIVWMPLIRKVLHWQSVSRIFTDQTAGQWRSGQCSLASQFHPNLETTC